jgi:hypothetical protein
MPLLIQNPFDGHIIDNQPYWSMFNLVYCSRTVKKYRIIFVEPELYRGYRPIQRSLNFLLMCWFFVSFKTLTNLTIKQTPYDYPIEGVKTVKGVSSSLALMQMVNLTSKFRISNWSTNILIYVSIFLTKRFKTC